MKNKKIGSSSFFKNQLVAVILVNFLSLTLVTVLLYSNFAKGYKDNLVEVISSQSKLLAAASRSALIFDDPQSAKTLLKVSSNLSEARFVGLFNSDMELFAEYKRNSNSEFNPPSELKEGATSIGDDFYFKETVLLDQELIGYLIVQAETKSLAGQQSNSLQIVLSVLFVSMGLSYIFNSRLQKVLTKPLNELIHLIRYVTTKRKYDKRLTVNRNDELGELFKGVNNVLAIVEVHQKQMSTHAEELEMLVELRTEQLYLRANYDALTQLPNRHFLLDKLTKGIETAQQNNTQLAVMFLDLDRFKVINDSLGHDVGDEVLIEVSKQLSAIMRKEDSVCRWGGDEFVLLAEDICSNEELEHIAKRVIESLTQPIQIQGHQLHVSTSIGIAVYPEREADAVALLKHADISMYHAKHNGPGQYCFFDNEMQIESTRRLSMENQLREAIKNEEFEMVYQPQFCSLTKTLHGLEALIRWSTPEGLVSPAYFIPLAEEVGLINSLSMWIINRVCLQIKEWEILEYNLVPVAINLPGNLIMQPDFPEVMQTILSNHNVNAHLVEIEITENTFISSTELAIDSLSKLRALGIKVAIDDFGTGYSCMSYLTTLPIDKLKIDGSFVNRLGQEDANDGIVEALLTLGSSLGFVTVGECVETEYQLNVLQKLGCDLIQGYYFSKPLSNIEVSKYMNEKKV